MNLLKLDKFGNVMWTKEFYNTIGNSIKQTLDGGYIVSGLALDTNSLINRGMLMRLDNQGNRLWQKFYSASYLRKVIILNSGDFLACGRYDPPDSIYAYILKTDSEGNQIWNYILTVGSNAYDIIESNKLNIYYFTGNIGFGQNARTLIGKIKYDGNLIWYKYGAIRGSNSILEDSQKNLIISGGSNFTKYDTSGNFIFQKSFPNFSFEDMCKTSKGNYALAGGYGSDVLFARIDSNGVLLDSSIIGSASNMSDYGEAIYPCSDGGFVITGLTDYPTGNDIYSNVYVIKTDSSGYTPPLSINQVSNEIPLKFKLHQNYPNPFNGQTKIKFELKKYSKVKLYIHDILGRELETLVDDKLEAGEYSYFYEPSFSLSSGIYFYKIDADNFSETKRMVLVK